MAWSVEIDRDARKDLKKLDPQIAKCILSFLFDRLSKLENPRSLGEALTGPRFGEYWKYCIGDYRTIVKIEDTVLAIIVVAIGNRREVYRCAVAFVCVAEIAMREPSARGAALVPALPGPRS
jgi:mRNA interferase RelE/StbE